MVWLFHVTINDISILHVTVYRCAGGVYNENKDNNEIVVENIFNLKTYS